MKKFLSLLITLCFASHCLASVSESELTTIKRYLGPSLMKIFNTTTVNVEKIQEFIEKNEYMAKYLSKFANSKKHAIKDMPSSFFHGLMYPKVEKLDAYEKLSAEAFVNNENYHKNFQLFRKDFPQAQCYSANYTITVMDIQNTLDWDSFDPMILYFGIMSIVENIDASTPEQQQKLEVGLKNMTEGLSQLEESINKAVAAGKYNEGCVKEVLETIEAFKTVFSSIEELKKRFDAFRHSNSCCPIEKLSKIAKEIDHYYFESMTTNNLAFRMTAMDLGEMLLKLVA